jgi:hypothetical protein
VRIRQYAEFFGSPKARAIALHRRSKNGVRMLMTCIDGQAELILLL